MSTYQSIHCDSHYHKAVLRKYEEYTTNVRETHLELLVALRPSHLHIHYCLCTRTPTSMISYSAVSHQYYNVLVIISNDEIKIEFTEDEESAKAGEAGNL